MLVPGHMAPHLCAEGVDGAPLRWPGGEGRGLLVAFLRPAESPHGRLALLELQAARGELAAADIGLVAVIPSRREAILARPEARELPAVADPEGALAAAWGMGRDPLGLYTLRGLQQGLCSRREALRALRLGGSPRALRAPWLPATLLLDAEGRVRWSRLGCSRTERPEIAGALAALRQW